MTGAPLGHGDESPHGKRDCEADRGSTPRSDRDSEREAAFISAAATRLDRWQEHVDARLEIGAREYGDAWAERDAADLIAEAAEEAADLGGWTVLADQRLDALSLADDDAATVHHLLAEAARKGAQAHAHLSAAAALLGLGERQ